MAADLFKTKLLEKIKQSTGSLVIIADKDGVLCPPHGRIEPLTEIIDLVNAGALFVVISGASIDRAEKESIEPLMDAVGKNVQYLEKISLILNNGGSIYRFINGKYKPTFFSSIKTELGEQKVLKALKILDETVEKFSEIRGIKEKYPEIKQINDEETQIVLRILGKMKNDSLRKTFDPHGKKRKVWAEHIANRFREENINLNVSVDGTSSINILLPGINKGSGIDKFTEQLDLDKSDLLYLGDAFNEKRNDRIAVENRIDLAVNFGPDLDEEIPGVVLINAFEKGPVGAKSYLKLIHELLTAKRATGQ